MSPSEERLDRNFRWFLSASPAPAGEPPAAVRRVGRYRLGELLGEGGMGVVFRARDEELGRDVALKLLKTARAYSPAWVERFRREVRNTARLSHPGIVTVHDFGREGDALYYTMELVDGRPFDAVGAEVNRRVRILERVARAVQAAHEQGVIHRDLKPGNILVDCRDEPHLLDFGLSRELETPSDLSRTGALMGSPFTMAPEQAAGRVHELDVRCDVYALGAILYEVLAGQRPFEGLSVEEIVRRLLTEDPKRPPGPRDLVTICLKAMEKDPARRTPTAAAFANDLARYLAGEPILARPAGAVTRLAARLRRNPTASGLGLGAGAALVAALAIGLVAMEKSRRLEAEREAALQAIRERARESLRDALEFRRFGANRRMGTFLMRLESAYRDAVSRAPGLAEVDYLRGRMHRALMDDERALEYQERALVKEPNYAPALYERVVLLSQKYGREYQRGWHDLLRALEGHKEPSRDEVERVRGDLPLLRKRIVDDCVALQGRVGQAHVLAAAGILSYYQGEYAAAQEMLSRALENDASLEEAWETLALSARAQAVSGAADREEFWKKAEEGYTQGIARDRGYLPHRLGRSEVRLERARYRRGRAQDPLDDFADAERDLEEALGIDRDYHEAWIRLSIVRTHRGIHRMYTGEDALGDYAAAEAALREALELRPKSAEAWSRSGIVKKDRGIYRVYRRENPLDDFAGAEQDLTRSLELEPESAATWNARAVARLHRGIFRLSCGEDPLGDFGLAEEDFERAIRLDPTRGEFRARRGHLRIEWGNYVLARKGDPLKHYADAEKDLAESLKEGEWEALARVFRGMLRTYRGIHHMSRGEDPMPDFSAAEQDLNQALGLNRTLTRAWSQRGHLHATRALFRDGRGDRPGARADYAAAARDYAEAIRINPLLEPQFGEALRQAQEKSAH